MLALEIVTMVMKRLTIHRILISRNPCPLCRWKWTKSRPSKCIVSRKLHYSISQIATKYISLKFFLLISRYEPYIQNTSSHSGMVQESCWGLLHLNGGEHVPMGTCHWGWVGMPLAVLCESDLKVLKQSLYDQICCQVIPTFGGRCGEWSNVGTLVYLVV